MNFLDVTLDLKSGKHWPCTKPRSVPSYVHVKSKLSNHPPTILRNILEDINKRLSEILSDEEYFDKAKPLYQDALNNSGYNYKIEIELQQRTANTKKPTQEHHRV